MPSCPNCGEEYAEGEEVCPNCGQELSGTGEEGGERFVDDEPALLTTAYNGIEADILAARLESAGIPCYRRPFSHGDLNRIILGPASVGADIFVPSKMLDAARKLLEGEDLPEETDEADGTTESPPDEPQTLPASPERGARHGRQKGIYDHWSKKYLRRRLLAVLVVVLVLAAYFSLDAILTLIRRLFGFQG